MYVVRCNAMDLSNEPGMETSASPPLNRSGEPHGPAATPFDMSKGVSWYQSRCQAKRSDADTGLAGFMDQGYGSSILRSP